LIKSGLKGSSSWFAHRAAGQWCNSAPLCRLHGLKARPHAADSKAASPTRVLAFHACIELSQPFRNSAATMSDYDEELEETLQNVS
jgi:hypothetical protein